MTPRSIDMTEDYRRALPMRTVCERLGFPVNETGFIPCPNHEELTPSCRVFDDHVHCFGCGYHRDNIGLVRDVLNLDFWGALEWIAREAGLPVPRRDPEAQKRYEAVRSTSEIYTALFQDAQKNPDTALAYLEGRGIPREIATGCVGYLAPDYQPQDIEAAKHAGLYSRRGNFLFAGRLVIPIYRHGQIVRLYGRALDDDRTPKHIYPTSTEPPMPPALWGLDGVRHEKQVYLCEAIIDALTLRAHGLPAVAAFGTQGLTDERADLLKRAGIERVTLVFDTDANGSGQNGSVKAGEKLFRRGMDVNIITLPLTRGQNKTDPNSFFQTSTPDDFLSLAAKPLFDSLLDGIPQDAPAPQKFKRVAALLDLVSGQPEILWKSYTETIKGRCPEFDARELKKEIGRLRESATAKEQATDKLLPLAVAAMIQAEAPTLACDGRFYRYSGGVYSWTYPEEIDQAVIRILGQRSKPSQWESARKALNVNCFVRPETLNPPGLLNLANGVLDLSTGEQKEHSPDLPLTVQTSTAFDQNAECPLWLETLAQILPERDLRDLLAQIFGYCLTPDISQQRAFLFFGEGANGKSVVTDTLLAFLGPVNCSALHLSDFTERFRIAELQGKLVNFSTEVEARGFVSDARIKAIITGDPLMAERKGQPPFMFRPHCKLIVSCNNLPETRDRSLGYFRRWIIMPFTQTFSREQGNRDKHRARKIIESELPGILNWAIGGYRSLQGTGGFLEPESCQAALTDYQRDADHTIEFCEQRLTKVPGLRLALKDISELYREWAETRGHKPLGWTKLRQAIQRNMQAKGIKGESGVVFPDLTLKP